MEAIFCLIVFNLCTTYTLVVSYNAAASQTWILFFTDPFWKPVETSTNPFFALAVGCEVFLFECAFLLIYRGVYIKRWLPWIKDLKEKRFSNGNKNQNNDPKKKLGATEISTPKVTEKATDKVVAELTTKLKVAETLIATLTARLDATEKLIGTLTKKLEATEELTDSLTNTLIARLKAKNDAVKKN